MEKFFIEFPSYFNLCLTVLTVKLILVICNILRRFHHAIGAMHLMGEAIDVLRSKGHTITEEEAEAATIAILLHDIGHGPFSHALEDSIASGIHHEELSELFMDKLNKDFDKKLSM